MSDLCWKTPGHAMRAWAEKWEEEVGGQGHGLGDLSRPCQARPGEICPACGKEWYTLQ